jgi:hypothetical protein
MKISVDLSEVKSCAKPGCTHAGFVSRHHKRHEKHFINLWERIGPPLYKGSKEKGRRLFLQLKARYHQFRPSDTEDLCEWHHVEIHLLYSQVWKNFEAKFAKPRAQWSYEEALQAMRGAEREFYAWVKLKTSGTSPTRARAIGRWSRD